MNKRKYGPYLLLAGFLILVLLAPFFCPYSPEEQDLTASKLAPSLTHVLGTDQYGRDVFSRILSGGRVSVYSSFFVVLLTGIIGSFLGMIAGYLEGFPGRVIHAWTQLFFMIPELIFAIAIAGILGGGFQNALLALCLVGWPKYARLSKTLLRMEKEKNYVKSAAMSLNSDWKIIWSHIWPNMKNNLITTEILDLGSCMMEMASLSFLGLGVKPPMSEWGAMLSEGSRYLQLAPWMIFAPGCAIFLTVLFFRLLGSWKRKLDE